VTRGLSPVSRNVRTAGQLREALRRPVRRWRLMTARSASVGVGSHIQAVGQVKADDPGAQAGPGAYIEPTPQVHAVHEEDPRS
jgi:hypothetical protein